MRMEQAAYDSGRRIVSPLTLESLVCSATHGLNELKLALRLHLLI